MILFQQYDKMSNMLILEYHDKFSRLKYNNWYLDLLIIKCYCNHSKCMPSMVFNTKKLCVHTLMLPFLYKGLWSIVLLLLF